MRTGRSITAAFQQMLANIWLNCLNSRKIKLRAVLYLTFLQFILNYRSYSFVNTPEGDLKRLGFKEAEASLFMRDVLLLYILKYINKCISIIIHN